MNQYVIKSGDNLWNIVKTNYKDHAKTNADILNIVNKLAEVNELDDPNLIYAGETLNLPSYDSIFDTAAVQTDTADTDDETDVQRDLYAELFDWTKASYDDVTNGEDPDMYDFVESDIPYTNEEFTEPWMEGAANLAESNIEASDTVDDNGAINYQEFINQEVGNYEETFGESPFQLDDNGEIIDMLQDNFGALDLDKSSEIEKDELSAYYAAMDTMDSTDGTADGKLQFAAFSNTDLTSEEFQSRYQAAGELFGADFSDEE